MLKRNSVSYQTNPFTEGRNFYLSFSTNTFLPFTLLLYLMLWPTSQKFVCKQLDWQECLSRTFGLRWEQHPWSTDTWDAGSIQAGSVGAAHPPQCEHPKEAGTLLSILIANRGCGNVAMSKIKNLLRAGAEDSSAWISLLQGKKCHSLEIFDTIKLFSLREYQRIREIRKYQISNLVKKCLWLSKTHSQNKKDWGYDLVSKLAGFNSQYQRQEKRKEYLLCDMLGILICPSIVIVLLCLHMYLKTSCYI